MSCIIYSRFNIIDLKDIKNSNHENIILEKLNIKKYLKKDSMFLYNYEERLPIVSWTDIYNSFNTTTKKNFSNFIKYDEINITETTITNCGIIKTRRIACQTLKTYCVIIITR